MPALVMPDGNKQGNVPVNTLIWGPENTPSLTDQEGNTIPLKQTLSIPPIKAYAPSEPLKAGGTYSFHDDQSLLHTFTVADETMLTPPALPTVISGPTYQPRRGRELSAYLQGVNLWANQGP